MGRRHYFLVLLLAGAVGLGAWPAASQPRSDGQIVRDLIHSDLPLLAGGAENKWPQSFHNEESFGCVSRVAFGDWVLRELSEEDDDNAEWYRFQNYGAFHCFALVGRAYLREELDGAEFRPSYFVLLGTVEIENNRTELWAVQIGARPGSDYLLLSRPTGDGDIGTFNVLQTQCPRANVRDAGSISIILTRYCAINTRTDLVRLARRMAQRAPVGALTLVETNADDDGVDE
jgi:hypothetical protein